jgi:hypothetical protein
MVLVGLDPGRQARGLDQRPDGTPLRHPEVPYGDDWSDVEQRASVAWTPCRFGGERPRFVCSAAPNGVYRGWPVVKPYGAGRLFAYRRCYPNVRQCLSAKGGDLPAKRLTFNSRAGASPRILSSRRCALRLLLPATRWPQTPRWSGRTSRSAARSRAMRRHPPHCSGHALINLEHRKIDVLGNR